MGSTVYMGAWRKEAARFLKTNASLLAQRPVWLFSSGPMGEGDVDDLMHGWHFPPSCSRSPTGDFRHWDAIASWAGAIAAELGAEHAAEHVTEHAAEHAAEHSAVQPASPAEPASAAVPSS